MSVEQFKEKCKKLYLAKGASPNDSTINKLAILLDFNSDGIIDFNEFIEGSRLVKENCKSRLHFIEALFELQLFKKKLFKATILRTI